MIWPWQKLRPGDGLGLLIAIIFLAALAVISLRTPAPPQVGVDARFGPEWRCLSPGRGDPICVKLPPEH